METCAICLDSFAISENNTVKLRCGHAFHFSCCMRNLNHNSTCPLCRQNILAEQYQDNIQNILDNEYEGNGEGQNVINVDNSIYDMAERFRLDAQIEGLLYQAANNDIRNNPDSLEHSRRNIYDLCMRFSSESIRINNRYRDRDRREVLVYNQSDNGNGILRPIRGVIMYNDVVYINAPVYNING